MHINIFWGFWAEYSELQMIATEVTQADEALRDKLAPLAEPAAGTCGGWAWWDTPAWRTSDTVCGVWLVQQGPVLQNVKRNVRLRINFAKFCQV